MGPMRKIAIAVALLTAMLSPVIHAVLPVPARASDGSAGENKKVHWISGPMTPQYNHYRPGCGDPSRPEPRGVPATLTSAQYFGADDHSAPKVGEVYPVRVDFGVTAGVICYGSGHGEQPDIETDRVVAHIEITLPPNTQLILDDHHHIGCWMYDLNTKKQDDVSSNPDYHCPQGTSLNPGWQGGQWSLDTRRVRKGFVFMVTIPVSSTAPVNGQDFEGIVGGSGDMTPDPVKATVRVRAAA